MSRRFGKTAETALHPPADRVHLASAKSRFERLEFKPFTLLNKRQYFSGNKCASNDLRSRPDVSVEDAENRAWSIFRGTSLEDICRIRCHREESNSSVCVEYCTDPGCTLYCWSKSIIQIKINGAAVGPRALVHIEINGAAMRETWLLPRTLSGDGPHDHFVTRNTILRNTQIAMTTDSLPTLVYSY